MALTPDAALRKDRNTGKDELQHRHFATIATILRRLDVSDAFLEAFADELAPTNHKFDRRRFIRAVREG